MVIIGRSGCGKSILLKQIVGIMKPDKGEIFIDGVEITSLNEKELSQVRLKFGMLFQGGALFDSMTVAENVGFYLSEHTKLSKEEISLRVKERLSLVGLEGVEHLMPAELSGGMRKRVALARAICTNPKVLLYDEPTTGIDPVMSAGINRLIRKLQHELNLTSLVVTHDMACVYDIADRIAMLHKGEIIEIGTPQEIRSSPNPIVQQFIIGSSEGPITGDS